MNLVCVSGMADASASGGAGQVPTQRGEKRATAPYASVPPLRPLSAGPVRPSGPCCLGVAAEAPFLSGSESNVR